MSGFREDLRGIINKHSLEGNSDTPDFALADFLCAVLSNYEETVTERDRLATTEAPNPQPEDTGHTVSAAPTGCETENISFGELDARVDRHLEEHAEVFERIPDTGGPLVERAATALEGVQHESDASTTWIDFSRAAIEAVADWLEEEGHGDLDTIGTSPVLALRAQLSGDETE